MRTDILKIKNFKKITSLFIMLFSFTYNYAQCGCSVANTIDVTSGTTAIGTHTLGTDAGDGNRNRPKTSDDLCIVSSGGGNVIVTGTIYMNGGDLYLCSSDGTEIDFRPTLGATFNTSSGTVHQHTDIVFNSARTIEGFTWNIEEGTLDAFNITVKQDGNDNERGYLVVKSSAILDADVVNSAGQASFINYGTATVTASTSSNHVSAALENYGTLNVSGDLTRTYGSTINYGEIIVTGTLTLGGGNDSDMDLTGGIFRSDALSMTSGTYNADVGDCAVFYTTNVVGVNCGADYPNANINIIDETLDTGDSACNSEKNDGSHFTYTDFDNAPACAQTLPVQFIDVYFSNNVLHWATAEEKENEKFIIERSLDSQNFEAIGDVKGAGDSYHEIQYLFEDENPVLQTAYYRVKQVDIDGKYSYSKVVVKEGKEVGIVLYPNPVDGNEVNISINNIASTEFTYEIISSIGDIVFQENVLVEENVFRKNIDVENLIQGIYLIKVKTREDVIVQKMIIE